MNGDIEELLGRLADAGLAGKAGYDAMWKRGERRHVRMWIRHNYACGYCEENLIAGLIPIFSAQLDHLLPQSTYSHLRDVEDNWVLACFPCNQLKRNFDPWKRLPIATTGPSASDLAAIREALMRVCRDHLRPLRDQWNAMRERVAMAIANRG